MITSTPDILAALHAASPGQTIDLPPGTYPGLNVSGVDWKGLTLQASGAVLIAGLTANQAHGLGFNDVEFIPDPSHPVPQPGMEDNIIEVRRSSGIVINRGSVHGDVNQSRGVLWSYATSCQLNGVDIWGVHDGLANGHGVSNLVAGCHLHDIRRDGIETVDGSNCTYAGNTFNDFHHVGVVGVATVAQPGGGDHPDALQFWSADTGGYGHVVTDNVISQGSGRPMQGIFINDGGTAFRHSGFSITNNIVIGGDPNAETATGLDNSTLTGARIYAPAGEGAGLKPHFGVAPDCQNITSSDNLVIELDPQLFQALCRLSDGRLHQLENP